MRAWLLTALAAAGGLALTAGHVWSGLLEAGDPPVPQEDEPSGGLEASDDRIFLSEEDGRRAAQAALLPEGARSVLKVQGKLKYGEFVWNDRGVPAGPVKVHVDLRRQLVSVFRGPHEIGTAVSLYGVDRHETPLGRFPIMAKAKDHWSTSYQAPMPYTLRLTTDGVALHGSDVRRGRATHGCVGIPLEFARLLFEQAELGDVVEIVFSDASLA